MRTLEFKYLINCTSRCSHLDALAWPRYQQFLTPVQGCSGISCKIYGWEGFLWHLCNYLKGGSRHKNWCMAKVFSLLIRYFSNYYTLHRSDLAARDAPLDPRLNPIDCNIYLYWKLYVPNRSVYLRKKNIH